jgi:DNA-binding MarR family transcriptional regulator
MTDHRDVLVERLIDHMERMQTGMRSRTPVAWSDVELTMPQVRTMNFLSHGPKRMGDISAYLGRGMPSATSMVDRLVGKGLVERIEDSSDRRVVACRLTPPGKERVERFWRLGRLRIASLADKLSLEELETVVPAMEILSEAVHRDSVADSDEDPAVDGADPQSRASAVAAEPHIG